MKSAGKDCQAILTLRRKILLLWKGLPSFKSFVFNPAGLAAKLHYPRSDEVAQHGALQCREISARGPAAEAPFAFSAKRLCPRHSSGNVQARPSQHVGDVRFQQP